jgi:hypothetical protein
VPYSAVGVSFVAAPAPTEDELVDALSTVARRLRVPLSLEPPGGNMPLRHFWYAVVVVSLSLLAHGWLTRPARYTFQPLAGGTPRQWVRVDHWTGELRAGEIQPKDARAAGWWQPIAN